METVACGEVSPPQVRLTWQEAEREDSRTDLDQAEATLLLANRSTEQLVVEIELTLDVNGQGDTSKTLQRRLPALRLEGGSTEALTIPLEELGGIEAGTSFVAAHAFIAGPEDGPLGQSASPVLYLRAEPNGGLAAFGEASLRQQSATQVVTASLQTGSAGIPEGVTLEMAFEAGEGELHGALVGPNDEEMER